MSTSRLDHLLANGPLPPGPAFDIAIAVSNRVSKSAEPCGSVSIRADRVRIAPDGIVQIALIPDPGSSASADAQAIAALLCEMLVGTPYRADHHAIQMAEVTKALELWPGGTPAIAAVDELLKGGASSPTQLYERLAAVRAKLGGSPLAVWLQNVNGTPQPAARYGGDPVNPELATGMIPVGALAKIASDANRSTASAAPPPQPSPVKRSPTDDLDAVLKAVANAPAASTPIPESPRPNVTRRALPSAGLLLSGVVLWGLTVILLGIALLLVWFLLH